MNAGHPPGFAMIDDEEIHPLSTGSCPVGFFPEMKIEKATLSYKDKIQLLLFTDGVMEAVEKDGIDGLEQLKAVISEKWLDGSNEEPINFVMPQELQLEQPDDMCVVFIQAH